MEPAARATVESGEAPPAASSSSVAVLPRTVSPRRCTLDRRASMQVTVVGDEVHLPYDRVALSRRLVDSEDLTLGDRGDVGCRRRAVPRRHRP